MACMLSSGARTALVLGVFLLLILSSQQVLATHATGQAFIEQKLQKTSAPKAAPSSWYLLMRRITRSTPFWRTMGSKPLGAFCRQALECSTYTCRNGHCADPQVKS